MKEYTVFCLFFLLVSLFAYPVLAAPAGSCVACHTSESLMKSLHKPPSLPAGEGEG